MPYSRRILNRLLDAYENSMLSRGENKVRINIQLAFTKKSMPEYFDESSTEYENIHACISELEDRNFVSVKWRGGKKGHIVDKVFLNAERVEGIYRYLRRTPKSEYISRQQQAVLAAKKLYGTPVALSFMDWLLDRFAKGLSVKEYIDIEDNARTARLLECIARVEGNDAPHYFREFSILNFGDSKVFDEFRPVIKSIFCRFCPGMEEADEKEVFSEYRIYATPDYAYLKGEGLLVTHEGNFSLATLSQGIGISGADLADVGVMGTGKTRRVITIENLTTFFQWKEEGSLIIYLGGYHNSSRRNLLKMIYKALPSAEYLHFGDIDAGGFAIFEDLCAKTGIAFKPYRMGIEELKQYRRYTKELTSNDRKRLEKQILDAEGKGRAYTDVLRYMLDNGVKLEQECIGAEDTSAGD